MLYDLGFRFWSLGFRRHTLCFMSYAPGGILKVIGFRREALGVRLRDLGFKRYALGFRFLPFGFWR